MMESAKGIFRPPANQGLVLRAFNRQKRTAKLTSDRAKMDAFADLLADGYEPSAAALIMGWVPEFGETMLARICKRLGTQAR